MAYSSYEVKQSGERVSRKSATAAMGVGAKVGPIDQSTTATAALSVERNSSSSSQVTAQYEAGAVPRCAVVRRKLVELLQILRVRHLNILIDEWSTLDPTGSLMTQPLFAEYIKRSFAGSPLISVKIATNRYQTRFSNRGSGGNYTGVEVGADVFDAVNLDRVILDSSHLESFFELLLYKRLLHRERALAVSRRGTAGARTSSSSCRSSGIGAHSPNWCADRRASPEIS